MLCLPSPVSRLLLLIITLSIFTYIFPFEIQYTNTTERGHIRPTQIENRNYYSLSELQRALKTANHFIDYENNKLNFNIYEEAVIIYLNTNFASSRGRLSNMSYPVIQRGDEFYLPEMFFSHSLSLFFPEKFVWDTTLNVLRTEKPVDRRIKTIVIDPGHGGKDPGGLGRKYHEKDVVLQIAKKLKSRLEAELDVNVILTRSTDQFVSLSDRTAFANQHKGDLFISLHCNASTARSATGLEVYILSAARTDEERAIEAMENSVVLQYEGGRDAVKRYDDLQFILATMIQAEQLEESYDLAVRLQTELVNKTKFSDRGVKQAGFYVLRGAFMPAVLIELGFITNDKEAEDMMTSAYQNRAISAIVDGIVSFKMKYDFMW